MSSDTPFETSFYYDQYKLTVYDNLVVGIVYGIYIVLYVTSAYILLGKPGFTSSGPRMFMFGITTFMFVLGIIAQALRTAFRFQVMQSYLSLTSGDIWPLYRTIVVFYVEAAITRLMSVPGALWFSGTETNESLPFFCSSFFGTIAAAGCELGLGLVPPSGNSFISNPGPLIMVGPTLGTNLLSTGLIAWKAWQRRVSIRKHLGEGNGSVRVERVFALLIESGFLYCCPWILYLISAFNVMPEPGFTVLDDVLLFISGLYPTLIIILIAIQKSPVEYYSNYSTGMQFASGPALRPPKAGDMRRHVYTICRDSDTQVPPTVFMKTSGGEKGL